MSRYFKYNYLNPTNLRGRGHKIRFRQRVYGNGVGNNQGN